MPDPFFPRISLPEVPKLTDYNLANTFYNRLKKHIEETQKQLKKDEQLALYYCGQDGDLILVTDIGYWNPNLIILYGRDSQSNECSILAHMESVQLILKILKVKDKAERRTIGFLK